MLRENITLKNREGGEIRGNLERLDFYLRNSHSHISKMIDEKKIDQISLDALDVIRDRIYYSGSYSNTGQFTDTNNHYFNLIFDYIGNAIRNDVNIETQIEELEKTLNLIEYIREDIQIAIDYTNGSDYKMYQQLNKYIIGSRVKKELIEAVNRRGIF